MIKFSGIGIALGEIEEKNDHLEHQFKWPEGKISDKTGINKRYITNDSQSTESLALEALENLNNEVSLDKIDFIISVTNTQTNIFPALAYSIQTNSKFPNAQFIGLNAGCSGFADALLLAYSGIASKLHKRVLIITSDTYSKFIKDDDQSIRPLFSDGASATLIEFNEEGYVLENFISNVAPNTLHHLCMIKDEKRRDYIKMNGPNVLTFAVGTVLPNLKNIIDPNKKYDLYPHQAGKLVLDTFIKKLGENININTNYAGFGNLVSTSIPNLIKDKSPHLKLEENIIISGFGVGLAHTSLILSKYKKR